MNEYSTRLSGDFINTSYRITSALSHDDAHVVSGSENGQIVIWGLLEGEVTRSWKAHTKVVESVLCHPKGGQIISTSTDGTVKVWGSKESS